MKGISEIIWKTGFSLSKAVHIHFSGILLCHKTKLPVTEYRMPLNISCYYTLKKNPG